MRILQVAPPWSELPPRRRGGIEATIATLTDGLVAAGHDVTLLATADSTTTATLASVYESGRALDRGDPVTELLHVVEADDLGDFDVVHDHTLLGTARAAARGTHGLVHTLHGPWTSRSRRLYRRLAGDVALVAVSHDQAATAPDVAIHGIVRPGLDVAAHPITLDRADHLVFVGRATPQEGAEQAIEVARRVGRPLRMSLRVETPAERRHWREVLDPRIRRIEAHIAFEASIEQEVEMLAGARAVVAPLRFPEPFFRVALSAGACGTPVVAFDRGAASEILHHGVTGVVVDPLAGLDAVCEAIEHAGTLDAVACRHHVGTHFSRDRMVADYLDVYDTVHEPRFKRHRARRVAAPTPAHAATGASTHVLSGH